MVLYVGEHSARINHKYRLSGRRRAILWTKASRNFLPWLKIVPELLFWKANSITTFSKIIPTEANFMWERALSEWIQLNAQQVIKGAKNHSNYAMSIFDKIWNTAILVVPAPLGSCFLKCKKGRNVQCHRAGEPQTFQEISKHSGNIPTAGLFSKPTV